MPGPKSDSPFAMGSDSIDQLFVFIKAGNKLPDRIGIALRLPFDDPANGIASSREQANIFT